MAVEIQEVEVVPRPPSGGQSGPAPPEEAQPAAPQPDLEYQIARTTSWLRSRDHRLRAD